MGGRGPDAATLAGFSAVVVLIGTNFVAVRFSNRELDPFWGAAARFLVTALVLVALALASGLPAPRGRALLGSALYGAFAIGAYFSLVYWALVDVPAGVAAVAYATVPLLTFLMAATIRLEPFRWRGLLGALVVLAGIALIFREQLRADAPWAALLALGLAAVFAAASGIVVKRAPHTHPLAMNAVGMTVGTALLLVATLAAGDAWSVPRRGATWAAFAWLVASSSALFALMVWVIGRWTATASSYSAVLAPLVTVAVAAWLAGETVTAPFVLGGAVVLVGVYVGAIAGHHKPKPAPAAPAPEHAAK